MSRGQLAVTLVIVGAAGFLGGALSDWVRGRPASAQVGLKPRRVMGHADLLDPRTRLTAQKLTEASLPPDEPLTLAEGTIPWVTYDDESKTFCALLARGPEGSILLRTTHVRLQMVLEAAFIHDDKIIADVKKYTPTGPTLLDIYEVFFVQTMPS